MEEYVIANLRAQSIRSDAKQTRKELSDNEKAAKETLVELMLASGNDSVRVAENEYYVIKKKAKKRTQSSDVVQELLSNMTLADINANASSRAGANAERPTSLVQAVTSHIKTCLLDGKIHPLNDEEEKEEATTMVLTSQAHIPMHFKEPASADTAEHLQAAALSYKQAELKKRIFKGRIKDMIDEVKAGVNESNELDAYEFATKNGATYRQVDQSVVARAINNSSGGGSSATTNTTSTTGTTATATTPCIYIKTERKEKVPNVSKKKFVEITDAVIRAAIENRFGNAGVDDNHIAEIAKQSTSFADAIDDCIEKNFIPESNLVVRVVSKKPKSR